MTINQKHVWTKPELELLLECTAIYGYGNWITISKAFNKTVFNEHFGRTNDFVKITPEGIMYLKKKIINSNNFFVSNILIILMIEHFKCVIINLLIFKPICLF